MDAKQEEIARKCLSAAHDGTMDFPTIVRALIDAGFEGYHVDFRSSTSTYYLPDGNSTVLPFSHPTAIVALDFRADGVEQAVREAQTDAAGYTYLGFCEAVKAAGCAGYMVSFPGRRVVYYGRSAETHVEHFPR